VSGQLLLLLKFVLLGLLYLFLFRVVRAVWAEISATRQSDGAAIAVPGTGSARRRSRTPSGVPLSTPPAASGAGAAVPPPAVAVPPPAVADAAPGASLPSPSPSALARSLVVVDPPTLADRQFPLEGDDLTLGRGAPSTIVLDDSFVSMVHARLRRTADGWVLEDLGSTNGTALNGSPVDGSRSVAPGDRLTLGGVTLEVR
jgi:hypothetical protein